MGYMYFYKLGSIMSPDITSIFHSSHDRNESGVSPVSKRYMRAGIGNERLLVCLSEYLP